MNKRIYFILLPLLAVLFFTSNSGGYISVAPAGSFREASLSHKSASHTHSSVSALGREDRQKIKNKIRIKACDDFLAIDIPAVFIYVNRIFYFDRADYGEYSSCYRSLRHHSNSLRGPPLA